MRLPILLSTSNLPIKMIRISIFSLWNTFPKIASAKLRLWKMNQLMTTGQNVSRLLWISLLEQQGSYHDRKIFQVFFCFAPTSLLLTNLHKNSNFSIFFLSIHYTFKYYRRLSETKQNFLCFLCNVNIDEGFHI